MRSSLLYHDKDNKEVLTVPPLNHDLVDSPIEYCRSASPDPFIPRHSDFTIPTSNAGTLVVPPHSLQTNGDDDASCSTPTHTNHERRSIFGNRVPYKATQPLHNGGTIVHVMIPKEQQQQHVTTPPQSPNSFFQANLSPLTPYDSVKKHRSTSTPIKDHVYFQSLILGFAFLCIWTPQNIMAPNLTEIAAQYGFDEMQRDVYLGANIALATGVLSLPISAGIGILADLYNRKHLFCICVVVGALASFCTGAAPSYRVLFAARFINGGCMSGSVPVAFSLLGDLFATQERNAASSGLTAMMGMGIIAGQVYAGTIGSTLGWSHAFYVSSGVTLFSAFLVLVLTREPIRGGKEHVLQEMLKHGTRYERKLNWQGFRHAVLTNKSNLILLQQGFFSSVPWGIIFVFLNDYLSQERGFSVKDATFLVLVFGVGCAAGGVLGGYWGQVLQSYKTSYLPIFMAITTFLGIFPFLLLLNSTFGEAHSVRAVLYSGLGGCIASLPSVNVRPCLLNVNPPETRGATLTAANLIINLARGAGPSCITLMGALWGVNRQFSFNVTLTLFWTVSAVQLLFLSHSLPRDQDAMETELARYAKNQIMSQQQPQEQDEVSIEDRMTNFDAGAARETVQFIHTAFRELSDELNHFACNNKSNSSNYFSSSSEEEDSLEDIEKKRELWKQQQLDYDFATEDTPLVIRHDAT